jgi:hypothetical protein
LEILKKYPMKRRIGQPERRKGEAEKSTLKTIGRGQRHRVLGKS